MSDNKCCFPWPRYWFPEGSNDYGTFIQRGYLTLPSPKYSRFYPTLPCQLSDLTQTPVLILLGEPGFGKSQAIIDERERFKTENPNEPIIFCDLKEFGDGLNHVPHPENTATQITSLTKQIRNTRCSRNQMHFFTIVKIIYHYIHYLVTHAFIANKLNSGISYSATKPQYKLISFEKPKRDGVCNPVTHVL